MKQSAMMTVVLFGDSITQACHCEAQRRWPELLRKRLAKCNPGRAVNVVNAGVGGNTSREGLARMERDVLSHGPDVVTVEFGGNDATPDPNRHVDLAEFRTHLETICRRVRAAGAEPVLLTFTPIIDAQHGFTGDSQFCEKGGPDAYIEDYRDATRTLARELDCELADIDRALRRSMEVDGQGEHILPDGVHLTACGNEVVASEVLRALEVLYTTGRMATLRVART